MSKGPGRIQRAIRQLFDANPDRAFITDELVEHCYPETGHWGASIEKKHTVAVLRAAHKVIASDPHWWPQSIGYGRNVGLCFVNLDSVESYALMQLITEEVMYRSRRPTRLRYNEVDEPDDLRALLYSDRYRKLIEPGGSWHRHVEMFRAERDGDTERLARLNTERAAFLTASFARLGSVTGRIADVPETEAPVDAAADPDAP